MGGPHQQNPQPQLSASSTADDVRAWLSANHPRQLAALDKFELELRLGRLSSAGASASSGAWSTGAEDDDQLSSSSPDYDGGDHHDGDHHHGHHRRSSSHSHLSSPGVGISDPRGDRRLVTSRTVELLKTLVGTTRWRNGGQLLALLRGLGRELGEAGAAGFRAEPAIGNVVRRIMSCVREEVLNVDAAAVAAAQRVEEEEDLDGDEDGDGGPTRRQRKGSVVKFASEAVAPGPGGKGDAGGRGGGGGGGGGNSLSLASMLWAHPQHVTVLKRSGSGVAAAMAPGSSSSSSRMRSESLGSVGSDTAGGGAASGPSSSSPSYYSSPLEALPPAFGVNRPELRQAVMEAIQEVANELEDVHKMINDQALSHIHAGEVILTYGRSKTVELFLKAAAAKKRKFQVVVCEGAPHFRGHVMARSLASAGIDTVVIHDSAACAIMARINKVLLPAHAVLANGGLVASSGSHVVALAAQKNAVPVVCITGMFKLCPRYPHEGQDTLNDLVSPSGVVDYADVMSDPSLSKVEFINPVHDYIPPQLVNLYVTNIGGFQPSYIYRLLAEYYHSDDWESFE